LAYFNQLNFPQLSLTLYIFLFPISATKMKCIGRWVCITASLLAGLQDYELTLPVLVDRHGAVLRPPTNTRLSHSASSTERRTRRSPHVSTITSPPIVRDDNSTPSRGNKLILCIIWWIFFYNYVN